MFSQLGDITRIEPNLALSFLRDQFAQSSAGAGRLILISGATASGKTRLHNEFHHYAAESGALTLSATGAPDEQELDGGVLDQLLSGAALPEEVPVPQDGSVALDVCRALLRLARDQPMVICVDDLQFADAGSLQSLLQLQRRIRSSRLLMVLTQWDRPYAGHQRLRTSFTRQAQHHVYLAPLSVRTIRKLVTESLDTRFGPEFPTQVHELSAGNPMLVKALIDDYRGGDRNGHPVVGRAFSGAVQTFLQQWDAPLRGVAAAVAVLGEHASPERTARVAEVDTDTAEEMTRILTDAGLLDANGFRHPHAEATALESLSPAARARLHLRAAELKHQRAATAREVATHLLAAGEVPADWSVRVLSEAAEQAARNDEVTFAANCLELALSTTTTEATRGVLLRALARITWRVNPSAAPAYLSALRQAAVDGAIEHADSALLVRHSLWHGDRETFTRALKVLAAEPEAIDARTEAELKLAYQWHYGPSLPRIADVSERHSGDPWNHTAATLCQIWSRGGDDATTASAERILRNCRLGDTALEALTTAIIALAHGGKAERAERWCVTLSEEASQRGATTWRAMLGGVWAGLLLRRGDIEGAAERARSALALLGTQGWGVSISYPLTTLLLSETAAGAFDAAADTLRHPVPEAMFATVGGLRYLRARGLFHLATDRTLAAISDFQECQRLMCNWDIDLPALVPWRTDIAEATLRLGDADTARDLAREQLDVASETDYYTLGSSWRVLAFVGEPAERSALLSRAAQYFRESGDRVELARTLKALDQLKQRADVPAVHGVRLPEQKRLTTRPAGKPVVRNAEPADPALLTEAELRVAQLAALGRTNRQIGSELFITVSTVEQHLTRVYRKLGVSGRSALPTELAITGQRA